MERSLDVSRIPTTRTPRLTVPTRSRDVFFVQKTRNWQVSHSLPIGTNLVNQFRFGYIEATANQHGSTADPADIDALKLTGVFTNLNDDQRS